MARAWTKSAAARVAASAEESDGMGWSCGKMEGAYDSFCSGGGDVDSVAAVMFRGWANIPTFHPMGRPCAPFVRGFMDENFGARGCQRGLVVVKGTVEVCV